MALTNEALHVHKADEKKTKFKLTYGELATVGLRAEPSGAALVVADKRITHKDAKVLTRFLRSVQMLLQGADISRLVLAESVSES